MNPILFYGLLTLLTPKAHAALDCTSQTVKVFSKFDALVTKLSAQKKDLAVKLNEFKSENGFPFPDSGGMDGPAQFYLLKTIPKRKNSKIALDSIYVTEKPNSKQSIHKWSVPEQSSPLAVRGNKIIIGQSIKQICGETSLNKTVYMAIQEDGNFELLDGDSIHLPEVKSIETEACTAIKTLLPGSDYGVCKETTDLDSKNKVVLVYEGPMT
jgi:hypothetical protein